MKLSQINEYRKAPLGQKFSKAIVVNLIADEDSAEMLRTHVAIDGADFVIIDYSFDSSNKLFAVVNRVDYEDVAAYMIVKKTGIGWQVQDVAVYSNFRNKGVGIDLYVKLINYGFQLISGYSLSTEAEKLWLTKLVKFVNVGTYNRIKNEVYPFSNEPELDKRSDSEQEWFYIANSRNAVIAGLDENFTEDGLGNLLYENWLLNRGTPIQSYRSSKFGDQGDF